MKRFFLILFALGSYFQLTAQEFRAGYIVTLKRDTVKGFLINGTDAELRSKITFRRTLQADENIEYRAADLLSFGFDYGRVFVRFPSTKTPVDGDSVFVFAKRILRGKIDLYSSSNAKKNHPDIFLVNNYTGQTVHLTEPEKLSTVDNSGGLRVGESLKHLGLTRIAKGDVPPDAEMKKYNYSERAIRDDISKYNDAFRDFPVSHYKQQINFSYSVSAGIPLSNIAPGDVAFRVAFYRNKYFPESSRKVSLIRGISYRYWQSATTGSGVQFSNENFRQQWISIIPIGVHIQTNSRIVKPFIYFGPGLAFLLSTDYNIYNYQDKGSKNEWLVTPTVNVGVGVKIKVGSKFLVAELTPTGNRSGSFINLGYSF